MPESLLQEHSAHTERAARIATGQWEAPEFALHWTEAGFAATQLIKIIDIIHSTVARNNWAVLSQCNCCSLDTALCLLARAWKRVQGACAGLHIAPALLLLVPGSLTRATVLHLDWKVAQVLCHFSSCQWLCLSFYSLLFSKSSALLPGPFSQTDPFSTGVSHLCCRFSIGLSLPLYSAFYFKSQCYLQIPGFCLLFFHSII